MGDAGNMQGAALAMQGASSFASSYSQSQAMESQGIFNAQLAETNARLARLQAEDAIARGEKEAANHKNRVGQMVGSQRAAMAAQGISVDSGSAAQIQAETYAIGDEDARTIRTNAWREAWGYQTQAINYQSQGQFDRMASRNQARNTLLTGGMQAASYGAQSYAAFKKN